MNTEFNFTSVSRFVPLGLETELLHTFEALLNNIYLFLYNILIFISLLFRRSLDFYKLERNLVIDTLCILVIYF